MYDLPYAIRYMVRGGKYRKCVIQWHRMGDHILNSGQIIYMELVA